MSLRKISSRLLSCCTSYKLTHELGRKLPRFGSQTLSIDSEPIDGAVVLLLPCWYLAAAD